VRVVVDTNVVVSGFFFGGVPGKILSAVGSEEFSIALSREIMDEYRRVGRDLACDHPSRREEFELFLAALAATALIVEAPGLTEPVSVDPADDKFLAAAVAAKATTIVSGDRHLLDLENWRNVVVLTPRQFHDQYLGRR
jgi:putative PIN family toxin of toxin-antitoxin system